MKKLINATFFTLSLITAQSAMSEDTMQFVQRLDGLKKIAAPQVVGYWMFESNLDNFYPALSDASSAGAASGIFNFGQKAFTGDPKGYSPFDPDYTASSWTRLPNASDVVAPVNGGTVVYAKSHTEGKYYFEVELVSTSTHDMLGFSPSTYGGANLSNIGNTKYIGHIGAPQNITKTHLVEWGNYRLVAGDVVQVWVDFDKDRLLIQKLGTTIDDHINPIIEMSTP